MCRPGSRNVGARRLQHCSRGTAILRHTGARDQILMQTLAHILTAAGRFFPSGPSLGSLLFADRCGGRASLAADTPNGRRFQRADHPILLEPRALLGLSLAR